MMMDNLDPREGAPEASREGVRPAEEAVPDVEIALPMARTSPAVHAWLDDEGSAAAALAAAPHEVAFWKTMDVESAARRRLATPAHVPAAIMQAIGHGASR